jgi:Ca2+-binding RTX toxin-like protein
MRHVSLLESRRLFASVFQGMPGYYEVTGTPGDDFIDIAVDQAAATFTLDGVTYGGVLHVAVDAGAGDDTVTVAASAPGAISASLRGGLGRDGLTLNINGAAWGDDDNDTIHLRNSFRGEAYGGGGDDSISLAGDCIDAQVEGGGGNDTIWALENNYGVVLFGGFGNDRLYGSRFDDVIFDGPGTDFVFGLDGDDEIISRDGELDWIMGGDGDDTLWADPREGGTHGVEAIFYG